MIGPAGIRCREEGVGSYENMAVLMVVLLIRRGLSSKRGWESFGQTIQESSIVAKRGLEKIEQTQQ